MMVVADLAEMWEETFQFARSECCDTPSGWINSWPSYEDGCTLPCYKVFNALFERPLQPLSEREVLLLLASGE